MINREKLQKNGYLKIMAYIIVVMLGIEVSRIGFSLMNEADTFLFYLGVLTNLVNILAMVYITKAITNSIFKTKQ